MTIRMSEMLLPPQANRGTRRFTVVLFPIRIRGLRGVGSSVLRTVMTNRNAPCIALNPSWDLRVSTSSDGVGPPAGVDIAYRRPVNFERLQNCTYVSSGRQVLAANMSNY
jgi:hypothetical protein